MWCGCRTKSRLYWVQLLPKLGVAPEAKKKKRKKEKPPKITKKTESGILLVKAVPVILSTKVGRHTRAERQFFD